MSKQVVKLKLTDNQVRKIYEIRDNYYMRKEDKKISDPVNAFYRKLQKAIKTNKKVDLWSIKPIKTTVIKQAVAEGIPLKSRVTLNKLIEKFPSGPPRYEK